MRLVFAPDGVIEVTGWNANSELRCIADRYLNSDVNLGGEPPSRLAELSKEDIVLRDPRYRVEFSKGGTMTLFERQLDGGLEKEVLSRSWLGGRLPSPLRKGAGDIYRRNQDHGYELQLNYSDVKLHFNKSDQLLMIEAPVGNGQFWIHPPHECGAPTGSQVVMPWQYAEMPHSIIDRGAIATNGETLFVGARDRVLRTTIATGETTHAYVGETRRSWGTGDGLIAWDGHATKHFSWSGDATALQFPPLEHATACPIIWDSTRRSFLTLINGGTSSTLWSYAQNASQAEQLSSIPAFPDWACDRFDVRLSPSGSVWVGTHQVSDPRLWRIDGSSLEQLTQADNSAKSVELLGVTREAVFYQVDDLAASWHTAGDGVFRMDHDGANVRRVLDRTLSSPAALETEHVLYVRGTEGVWRIDEMGTARKLTTDILCSDESGAMFAYDGYVYGTTSYRNEVQVWRIKE
jgi:hypothetical protein